MEKVLKAGAVLGSAVLAARFVGPKVHARLLSACERMFEHAPETFPPKRAMHGIDRCRTNTERILELLEGSFDAGNGAQLRSPSESATARTA